MGGKNAMYMYMCVCVILCYDHRLDRKGALSLLLSNTNKVFYI